MSSSPPPPSNWSLRFSFFLRAIGLKRGFRRTGPSTLLNLFVAAGVGVVSGRYIFKDPLDNYWREKLAEEQRLESSGETAAVSNSAVAAASGNAKPQN